MSSELQKGVQSLMLCMSAWKGGYCIDLWINIIMCEKELQPYRFSGKGKSDRLSGKKERVTSCQERRKYLILPKFQCLMNFDEGVNIFKMKSYLLEVYIRF